MTQFLVKVIRNDGKRYREKMDSRDKRSVYKAIEERGEKVISVTEAKQNKLFSRLKNVSIGGIKNQEVITAAHNLSTMLDAGLSLSRAISILQRQTRNKKLENVLNDIEKKIEGGSTLSEALSKHPKVFSKLFVAMVRAGEEGGNLSSVLTTLSNQMEKTEEIKKRTRGAMIYPGVILTVMVAIAVLMLTFIVPTLVDTFEDVGAELPASTQFIITVSDLLMNHTTLVLSTVLFIAVGGYYALFRTRRGKAFFDVAILHIPLIGGIVKEVNAARTSRTLSSLIQTGVDMVTALEITEDVIQNSRYKPVINDARKRIEKGTQISTAFIENEHLYPVLVGEMMAVGEETGNVGPMLADIATFYEKEVDQRTKDMSTIIEPFLMIIIGAGVGFFAISMLTPMYSILDSI